jgi:hypothetical protein
LPGGSYCPNVIRVIQNLPRHSITLYDVKTKDCGIKASNCCIRLLRIRKAAVVLRILGFHHHFHRLSPSLDAKVLKFRFEGNSSRLRAVQFPREHVASLFTRF